MKRVRVMLIEDHTIVRQGLVALLETADDMEVCGECGDGRRGLELALLAQPDVVVCDLALPGLGGLEVIRRMKEAGGRAPRILVLSMYHDGAWVQRATEAGADGYLLKGSAVGDLLMAIRAVARGETFLSPGANRAAQQEQLSKRETEVLTLLAQGLTSREIGATLRISPRTAEHHRARIMEKLGIHDIAGLTRFAIRSGLVDENLR